MNRLAGKFLECDWRVIAAFLIVASVSPLLGGCREKANTVSLTGHVSYRGEPLGNGIIAFFPVDGRPISGAILETGEYSLNVPPGDYAVTVDVSTEVPAGYKEGDKLPASKIAIPPQYSVRAKTTLSAKVQAGQNEPINFELK
ncbi:MAG: hypothetical protein U0805_03890 [Pirellulales bacterium]